MLIEAAETAGGGDLPAEFAGLWCDSPGVAVTTFYREHESAGAGLAGYAGQGLGQPYIVRLVELDGVPATAGLCVPGTIAAAYRTDLLGRTVEALTPVAAEAPLPGHRVCSMVRLGLRPYEIATLYLDLEMGRKQWRNLDAFRDVWATLHRVAAAVAG